MAILVQSSETTTMVTPNELMDLKLYLLTWNVVGRPPIEDLRNALHLTEPIDLSQLPDFFAIGLQELSCKPHDLIAEIIIEDPWVVAIRDILHTLDFIKMKQIRLQGMSLYLFCKREHVTHIRGLQTSYTRTGLKGMWGNKGAVTIRFSIYGCSVCIVNSHLAPHEENLQQRIEHYNSIIDHQKFVDPLTKNIITHDYTFWIGDLNFRLDDYTAEEIVHLVEKKNLSQLLPKDQLRRVMKLGQAFSEFSENLPSFNPSYRFHIGDSTYDLKRRPAWTDRILFRYTPDAYENFTLNMKQLHYDSHHSYIQSDHKPVSSSFLIKVFTNAPEKKVTFLPISDWRVHSDSAAWYTFSEGTEPSTWDWIGLYRADFSSTDDHVCYVWAPVRPSSSTPTIASDVYNDNDQSTEESPSSSIRQYGRPWYRIVFADQTLLIPGRYRLFYISSEFDTILGISEPFECKGDSDKDTNGGGLWYFFALLLSITVAVLGAIFMNMK